TGEPAHRLLVFQRPLAARCGARPRPGPDRRIDKPDDRFRFDVQRDHWMDEEPRRLAVPARAKTASLLVATGKVDLRRILNRQHPPPSALRRRPRRQGLDDPFNIHMWRRQKSMSRKLP